MKLFLSAFLVSVVTQSASAACTAGFSLWGGGGLVRNSIWVQVDGGKTIYCGSNGESHTSGGVMHNVYDCGVDGKVNFFPGDYRFVYCNTSCNL